MGRFFKNLAFALAFIALLFLLFSWRASIARGLSGITASVESWFLQSADRETILKLQSENQSLKDELALQQAKISVPQNDRYHYKLAQIYSRYPFNDMSMVVLNMGSADGIKEGMPVFVEKGVLLGKVRKVSRTQSEVETIWSATWKTSVAVGVDQAKAVYQGGGTPTLLYLSKDAKVAVGDSIVSVDPEIPLGTLMGTIADVSTKSYDVWQNANVKPLYDPGAYIDVLVMIDFP